ncbi:GFA family protein [Acidithiobacillus sp.]|uniref:GFA family protein n=1 Tax=Acidithiobacillus sp. TaxID=1872118 RepID=UPI00260742CF|nr:GFA family protein [Acidithiobacillus sp.]
MDTVILKGSCLCGSIHYEVTGNPAAFYHCHCKRCRKSTGTGHASNILMKEATLVFTCGEPLLRKYKIPEAKRFARQFCAHCGSQVARHVPEIAAVVIPAGSLESDAPLNPQARIFWDSRAEWSCGEDGLPRFPGYPD